MISQLSAFFGAFLGSGNQKKKGLWFFYHGFLLNGASHYKYFSGTAFCKHEDYDPESIITKVKAELSIDLGCSADSVILAAFTPLNSK